MNMTFQISHKTKSPACCGFDCCGNKFGRIERSKYAKYHGRISRMKLTRRYAKHVEKRIIQKEIAEQLHEEILDIEEFNREMEQMFDE